MTRPLFSIVIPTFNRRNLFPLAVRSILAQTFEDFEIIVSDNCSVDDTRRVARAFTDRRVKYVRTPRHFVIADSWEFARRQAVGQLIIVLSDDDAMVSSALERFAHEAAQRDADFLFSGVARYRDPSFPGTERNSVDCPAFSGSSRTVSVEEFVRPLFLFKPRFDMHPSAFVFSRAIADFVEARTGRFFWTNGVEFSAWPMAAIFAKHIVHIDLPLTILGRTGQSWGSNMNLCNPGKDRIQAFVHDVDHERKHAPLNNFSTSNLMAEGMLTAKGLFPAEFEHYEFDEVQYLRSTMKELSRRRSLGVDVAKEMDDALRYAVKYPTLVDELQTLQQQVPPNLTNRLRKGVRSMGRKLGVSALRRRVHVYRLTQKLTHGAPTSGFWASGDDFGFTDVLGCAAFLSKHITRSSQDVQLPAMTPGTDTFPPVTSSKTSATSVSFAARE